MSDITQSLSLRRAKQDPKYFYTWLGYDWGDYIEEWMNLYGTRGDVNVHRVCIIEPFGTIQNHTLRVAVLWSCLFERWRDNLLPLGYLVQAKTG